WSPDATTEYKKPFTASTRPPTHPSGPEPKVRSPRSSSGDPVLNSRVPSEPSAESVLRHESSELDPLTARWQGTREFRTGSLRWTGTRELGTGSLHYGRSHDA